MSDHPLTQLNSAPTHNATRSPESQTPVPETLSDRLIELIKAAVGPTQFEFWFDGDDSIQLQDGQVTIFAPSRFACSRLQSTFLREIRDSIDRVCGPHMELQFLARSDANGTPSNVQRPQTNVAGNTLPKRDSSATETSTDRSRKRASGKQGLSSFWFGEENRLAKTSVEHVVENLGQLSPLLVYGPCGSGKTQLLNAITQEVRRRLYNKRCVFMSAEQFTSFFLQSLRGTGLPMFRKKYRDLDLLVVDDIQFFEGKRATLNEFQYTIDNLIRSGKQVVVSSDRPPIELGSLGNDVVTRLTGGLVTPLNYAGHQGRVKIVQKMCQDRGFSFAPEVVDNICQRFTGDVRQLSGAINRLHTAAVSTGSLVTVEFAMNVLGDLFAENGLSTSMTRIEKAVCEFCGVRSADVKSPSRKRRVCTARMLAMYLSRQHTSSAYSEIGDYFGGRSHSTVIAAQRKVNHWLESDERINLPHASYRAKELVDRIKSQLKIG